MKIEQTVKKVTKPAIKFGAATGGLVVGSLVANKIPELTFLMNIPVVGKYLSRMAPGVAVMVAAYLLNAKVKNELVQAGAFGMGLAGFANAFKRIAADIPVLSMISDSIPSGLGNTSQGHAINAGHYPPTHWIDSNKAYTRSLNGPYSLEGTEGKGAYALGNTAFALEGR